MPRGEALMMVVMTHWPHATLSDHGGIICSPFPFAVRRDLPQSAGGPRQLPLPTRKGEKKPKRP